MQDSKFYNKYLKKQKPTNKLWVTKLLLSIIFILSSLIYVNISTKNKEKYMNNIFEDTISFTSINKLYDKYFGNLFTKEENKPQDIPTFNDTLVYESMSQYNNSTQFKVGSEYMVSILKPGIIVYIGDKDELGNTVIVQGNDGVDIWYSNVSITEYSLYDYVKSGDTLGVTNNEYL